MNFHLTPHASRPSATARLATRLFLGALGAATLGACGGATVDSSEEPIAKSEGALTNCVTIQNVGPTTTFVDDTAISTDPTDPTKANTNYGAVTTMTAGFVGTEYRRLLLKFDPLGAGIPSGALVGSASLRLRMTQSLGKNPVDLYAGTMLWDEHVTTWNQIAAAPNGGLGGLQATLVTLGVANSSYVDIPLPAALIESWLDPSFNYGLILDHPQAGRTTFGASEAAPSSRPTLQVCYDPPTCGDGRQDQGETGVDCGGPCPTICCADVPETCNGIDDNCDGQIDENLTQACASVCGGGVETCSAGSWVGCSAQAPQTCLNYGTCQQESTCGGCAGAPAEACNLVDDNCDGVCDGGQCQINVHRSFSPAGGHFYTTNAGEASAAGFAVEAYNYYRLYTSQPPGTVPFYRCYDLINRHLYTTNVGCEGYQNEGIMGYINTAPTCGSSPLYRLYGGNNDHYYTTDAGERANLIASGWVNEGIIGYVW